MSERKLVLEPVRRTGEDRGLSGGLQLAAATLGAQVLNARRVRTEGRFTFFHFEYHTSALPQGFPDGFPDGSAAAFAPAPALTQIRPRDEDLI